MCHRCAIIQYSSNKHRRQPIWQEFVYMRGLFLCLVFCPRSFNLYAVSLFQHFQFSIVTFWNLFTSNQQTQKQGTPSLSSPPPQMFTLVCCEWKSERQIKKEEQNQSKNEKKGRREKRNKGQVKWDGLKWVDQRGRLKISIRLMRLMAFFYLYFSVSPGLPAEEEVKLLVEHGS